LSAIAILLRIENEATESDMPRYDEFKDKVVFITGGGAGIGRETALAFAGQGARVGIADRDDDQAEETLALIRERGGEGLAFAADVARDATIRAAVDRTVEAYGRLDYAFTNAGITEPPCDDFAREEAAFDRLIAVNVKGTWSTARHALRHMAAAGRGSLVMMSSSAGITGAPGMSSYAMSKHAALGFTRSLAIQYARDGIRVNAVGPGAIATQMIDDFIDMAGGDPSVMDKIKAGHPMGRMGKPREVAEAVLWLCSDASSFVTGHLLLVDGGFTAA
jgi:NAD(P)-dependent dehydrogenase (short-subunit alcohol dehydrogenase family)